MSPRWTSWIHWKYYKQITLSNCKVSWNLISIDFHSPQTQFVYDHTASPGLDVRWRSPQIFATIQCGYKFYFYSIRQRVELSTWWTVIPTLTSSNRAKRICRLLVLQDSVILAPSISSPLPSEVYNNKFSNLDLLPILSRVIFSSDYFHKYMYAKLQKKFIQNYTIKYFM